MTDVAVPGMIVVLPGELGLRTGDTVCDESEPLVLAMPSFPAPVLAATFEPAQAEDAPRLAAALRELAVDDPTLRVDHEHDRIVVRGMGELHLDIVAELVRERTHLLFSPSRPQVDRRETVRGSGQGTAEVRALVAGRERTARCVVAIAPEDSEEPAVLRDAACVPGSPAAIEELRLRLLAGSQVGPVHGASVVLLEVRVEGGDFVEPCFAAGSRQGAGSRDEQAGVSS